MKEKITNRTVKCSKCGEYFEQFRGYTDTRCESCWDESDIKENTELLSKWQNGEQTL